MYAHACNKKHSSDSFREQIQRLNDIQITVVTGFEFDSYQILFIFSLLSSHWSTLINQQGSVNDQIAHTD